LRHEGLCGPGRTRTCGLDARFNPALIKLVRTAAGVVDLG
jgi:hypothetical protein